MDIKSKKKTKRIKQIVKSSSKKTIVGSGKKLVKAAIHSNKKIADSGKKHVEVATGSNKKFMHSNKKHVETIAAFNKKIADSEKKISTTAISSDKKKSDPDKKHIKVAIDFDKKVADPDEKHAEELINSNKEIVDSIEVELAQEAKAIADLVEEAFASSPVAEPADDTFDNIFNIYARQIDVNVDLSAKLLDAIKESRNGHPEKVFELMRENFETSRKLRLDITKEIVDLFNKHTNYVVNFNQNFGERINSQIESFFKIPGGGKVLNIQIE